MSMCLLLALFAQLSNCNQLELFFIDNETKSNYYKLSIGKNCFSINNYLGNLKSVKIQYDFDVQRSNVSTETISGHFYLILMQKI